MADGVSRPDGDAGMSCPTCSWPSRETVGMICQTYGTDYGPAPAAEADLREQIITRLHETNPLYYEDAADGLLPVLQRLIEQAVEGDCGHHSWAGLMALLDEHWPEDIFPTRTDDPGRDAGARIISLLRWVDRLTRQPTGGT